MGDILLFILGVLIVVGLSVINFKMAKKGIRFG